MPYRSRAPMHPPHSWDVATAAERIAQAPTLADRGRLCFQSFPAPGSYWAWTGTTWIRASVDDLPPLLVTGSRPLNAADNKRTLELAAADIQLTLPNTLPANFGVAILNNGTVGIVSANGVLLNGATTTITRATAANPMFAIVARNAANSYVVSGT